jgi:putative transposase
MPRYRRAFCPGGTFFFTLVTENRAPIFNTPAARTLLHRAIARCGKTRPFNNDAMVLLPDHLHLMLTLPPGDADYPTRIASIKANFTHAWLAENGHEEPRSASRIKARRRGVWQRHYWEHWVRDQDDYNQHLDYIVYNPVKHGLASCPHLWPYSSFERAVGRRLYSVDWQCTCDNRQPIQPNFDKLPVDQME